MQEKSPTHKKNNGASPIDGVFCNGVSMKVDPAWVRLLGYKKNRNSCKELVCCVYF